MPNVAAVPVIIAGVATWATVAYFAAAIGGFTDPAGNNSRWLSALYGLISLVIAALGIAYIVVWLRRPARPSELWPVFNKRSSRRIDD